MRSACWQARAPRACAGSVQMPADGGVQPKKRLYRSRAHSNPLNDSHFSVPAHPDAYDWSEQSLLAAFS